MRAKASAALISAALLGAVSACGADTRESDLSDALVGEWSGTCTVTHDEFGSEISEDSVVLRFDENGEYFQSIEGPAGGEVEGTYTVTEEMITLESGGQSVDVDYAVTGEGILTTTRDDPRDPPVTTTCDLRPTSGS